MDDVTWYYKDDAGDVQGPFSATKMRRWFVNGFFDASLEMSRNGTDFDCTLGSQFPDSTSAFTCCDTASVAPSHSNGEDPLIDDESKLCTQYTSSPRKSKVPKLKVPRLSIKQKSKSDSIGDVFGAEKKFKFSLRSPRHRKKDSSSFPHIASVSVSESTTADVDQQTSSTMGNKRSSVESALTYGDFSDDLDLVLSEQEDHRVSPELMPMSSSTSSRPFKKSNVEDTPEMVPVTVGMLDSGTDEDELLRSGVASVAGSVAVEPISEEIRKQPMARELFYLTKALAEATNRCKQATAEYESVKSHADLAAKVGSLEGENGALRLKVGKLMELLKDNNVAVPDSAKDHDERPPGLVRMRSTIFNGGEAPRPKQVTFGEDTPESRSAMVDVESDLNGLRAILKLTSKTGNKMCADGRTFFESMHAFGMVLCREEMGEVGNFTKEMGNLMISVSSSGNEMLEAWSSSFLHTAEHFAGGGLKEVNRVRKDLDKQRAEFERLEERYMAHGRVKRDSVSKMMVNRRNPMKSYDAEEERLKSEYLSIKAKYELTRCTQVTMLNELESKKLYLLPERLVKALHAFEQFFKTGSQRYELLQSFVSETSKLAIAYRSDFDKDHKVWEEKRSQLRSANVKGAFPFESRQRLIGGSDDPPEGQMESPPLPKGVSHQGWLYKRSSNVRRDWKKRFFQIRNGRLVYHSNDEIVVVQAVVLCTVRNVQSDSLRHVFEVISQKRKLLLQATSEHERVGWLEAMRDSIAEHLQKGDETDDFHAAVAVDSDEDAALGPTELMAANPNCAECGAKSPDWCSLNLGVLICIRCSGIHRSLGVHLSKVRSLTLDDLSDAQISLLSELGNDFVNSVYEADLESKQDLIQDSEIEAFVRQKYESMAFVAAESGELSQQEALENLRFFAKADDVKGAFRVLHEFRRGQQRLDCGEALKVAGPLTRVLLET